MAGRADNNRGDRRQEGNRDRVERKGQRCSRQRTYRHTKEAMHRKEGPNLKLTNNKRLWTAMHRQIRKQPR